MEYNYLRYITKIVEMGSMSKAANSLFISQSTLSKSINLMEKQIGYKIFERNNRGVQLTCEGVQFYKHAIEIVEQLKIFESTVIKNSLISKLRVSCFASNIISAEFFKLCQYLNHECDFELLECGTRESIENVLSKESDLCIIMYSEYQEKRVKNICDFENLKIVEIFQGDLRIMLSNNSPLANKKIIYNSDLKGMLFVKRANQIHGTFSLDTEYKIMGINNEYKTLIVNGKCYYDALSEFNSFSVGASWSCKTSIGKDVVRKQFEGTQIVMKCAYIKHEDTILNDELNIFIENLIEAYT